jgi:hypothetical protein
MASTATRIAASRSPLPVQRDKPGAYRIRHAPTGAVCSIIGVAAIVVAIVIAKSI